MTMSLSWESPYAIVQALRQAYPKRDFMSLSLNELERLVRALEGFQDEEDMVNDDILLEIYQLWYEESLHEQS